MSTEVIKSTEQYFRSIENITHIFGAFIERLIFDIKRFTSRIPTEPTEQFPSEAGDKELL